MTEIITSYNELIKYHIREIKNEMKGLLTTVDWRDTTCDCWIECVNDQGEKVRLIPDKTGWQDRRKEVMVMNTVTGRNRKLFFTDDGRPNETTLKDPELVNILWSIPNPVLEWASKRAV